MARTRLTRREFVGSSAATIAALKLDALAYTDANVKRIAADPLRPQCHLLPPGNWMNDPNGPIIWRGKVHLFYQVNPNGADWGTISWGHAVSSDMVYWKQLPVAMAPEAGFPDSYGVFSGSCVADGDRCLAFYTAVERSDVAHATIPGTPPLHEQQTVAVSTDRELLHWVRQPRALIPNAPIMKVAGFRDPCVWRDGNTWYMALGSGELGGEGMVLLYKATTPEGPKADWQYLHPLISAPGNGKDAKDPVDSGSMWECPDLFELDGHHVLLYSTERKVFWLTGTLNRETLRFEPKQRGLLDTGAYYAPKSMAGPKGERILWGWVPERRPKEQYIAAGWSGVMSFPRVLNVDQNGFLRMKVAPAIDSGLLTKPEQASTTEDIHAHIPGLAARITAIVPAEGSGFTVSVGNKKLLDVARLAPEHASVNGEDLSAYLADGITAYIDGSVVEIFFGDRSAHTLRIYPELHASDTLTIAAKGFSSIVTAQQLRPISNNRLTK